MDSHYTITLAVDPEVLVSWTEHKDRDRFRVEAKAVLSTTSLRDWLMSELSAASTYLGLTSLEWLATADEAPVRTTEHQDSRGDWWFVWVLYRDDILASVEGLGQVFRLAQEQPSRFGATAEEVNSALEWDRQSAEGDFKVPNGGDGDDPTFVLCAILALKRLLGLAHTERLCVVHLRYSFRAGESDA